MPIYVGIVHKDAGSAYGVTFPDLPGCFCAADDLESLPAAAQEAIALWMQDNVPETIIRAGDVVHVEPDAKFAMGFLYVLQSDSRVRINVSIDSGLLAAIDEAANLRGMTRSAFLAMAAMKQVATP